MKMAMAKAMKSILPDWRVELEWNAIPNRRADLWISGFCPRGKERQIAVECQASPISIDTMISRTCDYSDSDIYVLWAWNANRFSKAFDSVPGEMLACSEIYFGRVYAIDVISNQIFAIRFLNNLHSDARTKKAVKRWPLVKAEHEIRYSANRNLKMILFGDSIRS